MARGGAIPLVLSRKVLNVKELAGSLKVHPSTVYRLMKKGGLPGFKVGSDWRFNLETVDRWRQDQEKLGQ